MWLLNYHIMSDDPERKRLPGNFTSSSCSDLSLKRTKLRESTITDFSEKSLNPGSPLHCSTPCVPSVPTPQPATMTDQAHSDSSGQVTVPLNQLDDMISNIMKRHLQQQKEDIVNVISGKFSNEIEDLQMKVASLQFENENLAERVKILEGAKDKNDSTIARGPYPIGI